MSLIGLAHGHRPGHPLGTRSAEGRGTPTVWESPFPHILAGICSCPLGDSLSNWRGFCLAVALVVRDLEHFSTHCVGQTFV